MKTYITKDDVVFRKSTSNDFLWIKQLWYSNRDTLSIPFSRCITALCEDENCIIAELDGSPIGIGTICFKPRMYEIRIEHLVIDKNYRGKGLGTLILSTLINNFVVKDIGLFEPEIVAYAVVGATNNRFYSKYAKSKSLVHRKTKDLYRFVLDKGVIK